MIASCVNVFIFIKLFEFFRFFQYISPMRWETAGIGGIFMNMAAFLSYALIAIFTPGPNTLTAMASSAKYGFRNALRFCLGVFFGFLVDMTLCAAATSVLYESIPRVEPVMRCVGAAYILFLAWVIFRDAPEEKEGEPAPGKSRLHPCSVVTGTVLQLVNVKLLMLGITVFATFILPHRREGWVLLLVIVGLAATGFVATVCWALFGSLFQGVYARRRKAVNAVMALLLVYCAVMSFL